MSYRWNIWQGHQIEAGINELDESIVEDGSGGGEAFFGF